MRCIHPHIENARISAPPTPHDLKAIAVYGTKKATVARPDEMAEQVKSALQKLKENPVTGTGGGLQTYGTAVLVNALNCQGAYPTRNFQTGYFPDADKQSGETLAEKYLTGKKACFQSVAGGLHRSRMVHSA